MHEGTLTSQQAHSRRDGPIAMPELVQPWRLRAAQARQRQYNRTKRQQ